jgi:hypothetical protein
VRAAIRKIVTRGPSKLRRLAHAAWLARRWAHEPPGAPPSDAPIEVVIPIIAKDLPTLPLVVASIRRFVRHPVRRITLVSPADPRIIEAAASLEVTWRDERDLLSPWARTLELRPGGVDRSGWLKQQLLKLGGDAAVEADRFLVVDADTAFARDVVFVRAGKNVLFCSDEHHQAYFGAYRRLIGLDERYGLSFVAHHMLFERRLLADLRRWIEERNHRPWDEAIFAALDPQEPSAFSEYETYGNFCFYLRPEAVTVRYWHNLALRTLAVRDVDELGARYGARHNTVSFHSWARKEP